MPTSRHFVRLDERDASSDGRLVTQCSGQLTTAGDPELFVDTLQVALDRSHRDVTVCGNLLVGTACRGLHRCVELAGGETGLCPDCPDHRGRRALATAEELPGPVLLGCRLTGASATAQDRGRFDAGLGRIEVAAQFSNPSETTWSASASLAATASA